MAVKRKAEGIALLSVYGGDDDDGASQASSSDEEEEGEDGENAVRPPQDGSSPPADGDIFGSGLRALGGDDDEDDDDGDPQPATASPSGTHTTSPGNLPENAAEGSTLQPAEAIDTEDKNSGAVEGEKVPESETMEVDILSDFLPPVPAEKYTGELQTKFSKYLALKKTGKSLNEQLRNTKGYRNPDFLQSAVRHYDIDHIGSCFKKEIFDPHGFDESDYYDAIALEIRREAERKELERRQTQRVDFVRNSIQTAAAVAKPILPLVQRATILTTTETTVRTEGRISKKSKWDKVDVDAGRTTQSITSAADAIAAANAHAALLTASANAGAGYASFAQQRRREAEEKSRATEKVPLSSTSKLDRKLERS
ncbi:unnamed protein product [Calypogeia fissa]